VTARRSREGAVSRPLSVRSLDGRCELSDMRHGVARMGTFYVIDPGLSNVLCSTPLGVQDAACGGSGAAGATT